MRRFQPGTPECGAAMAILGAAVALMILFMGFWRTLFVALLAGAGYFAGGVSDKSAAVKKAINRLFPPKDE